MTLALSPPVMVASGCGGTGRELAPYVDLASLGAFVTRTLTRDPRRGDPTPRIVESPSGLVNSVGLPNPGIHGFLATELPWLVRQGARVVVSITGGSLTDYTELTRSLAPAPGVAGLELDLSVPDTGRLGVYDAREPGQAAAVISAVRRELPAELPVWAKLRPELGRVTETARAAAEAGADGVVLINSLPARMPDGRTGGLSGPAIRPIALRCVAEAAAALPGVTVIGCGGISSLADAREFLDAGATAVQVGTGQLHDPTTLARLVAGLTDPGHDQGDRS